jgi:hypothetical protein
LAFLETAFSNCDFLDSINPETREVGVWQTFVSASPFPRATEVIAKIKKKDVIIYENSILDRKDHEVDGASCHGCLNDQSMASFES